MAFRIYADESGTNSEHWLVIGMLFVPDHGALHSSLCKSKERLEYYNGSPKRKARYKETHLTEFRSSRDVEVAKEWIAAFVQHNCYYRAIVIDWTKWDSRHFGDPFEPEALKRLRAYKKWAEMLLHPELKSRNNGIQITGAQFYLDRLRIMYGYDVIDYLRERFTRNYKGESPHIAKFEHTDSWRDANQCLQLCDLLSGALYQSLEPAKKLVKLQVRDHLAQALLPFGVARFNSGFWKQYEQETLNQHLPKYSAWFWRPQSARSAKRKNRR